MCESELKGGKIRCRTHTGAEPRKKACGARKLELGDAKFKCMDRKLWGNFVNGTKMVNKFIRYH